MRLAKTLPHSAATCLILLTVTCSQETQFQGSPQSGSFNEHGYADSSINEAETQPHHWVETFAAGEFGDMELSLRGNFESAALTFPLMQETLTAEREFTQNARATYHDEFRQGSGSVNAEERFQQNNLGILDVVLVVDNSNSMREEQENLAQRLEPLVSAIDNTDWRIAITSTDPKDGCVVKVITHNDPQRDELFQQTILGLGVQGARNELGFYQARQALECPSPAWMRPQSNLAIIFVSDEDNCGNGNNCDSHPESEMPAYLTNYLGMKRVLGEDVRLYGLIWEPGTDCPVGGFPGERYKAAITAARGLTGSVCSSDYTPVLKEISKDILSTLKEQVLLSYLPLTGSVRVLVNGVDYSNDVVVQQQVVRFKKAPPVNAVIVVRYQHADQSLVKEVALKETNVDYETLRVLVNEEELTPLDYSFDAQNSLVQFAKTPPANSKIVVTYKKHEKRWQELKLSEEIDPTTLKITVNGSPDESYDYDEAQRTIRFHVIPPDAAKIRLRFKHFGKPQLEYAFQPDFEAIQNLAVTWADNGEAVEFVTAPQKIILKPQDFKRGRVVRVEYKNALGNIDVVPLAHLPYRDQLEFFLEQSSCVPEDFAIREQFLYADCDLKVGEEVRVRYRYLVAQRQDFHLTIPASPDHYEWRVWIDGNETVEFARQGKTISVLTPLAPEAAVRIEARY